MRVFLHPAPEFYSPKNDRFPAGNAIRCVTLITMTDKAALRRRRSRSRLKKGSAKADKLAHLAQADQHIAGVKERIDKQRKLIERLAAEGHGVRDAEGFLFALTGVLSAFESHRRLILDRLR